MIDAILFDLDGTLIDTEKHALKAGLEAFSKMGHPRSVEFMHALVGVDLPTASEIISQALPGLDQDLLNDHWRKGYHASLDDGLLVKPDVLELLTLKLRPMAIVTSSGRDEAHHKLRLTGLDGYFDQIITLQDVTAPKPAPDPYLLAARLLGVAPSRCLVFEDSETGAQAAHRAGCIVVQVPDVVPSQGRWAHHLATSLMHGARLAGLV